MKGLRELISHRRKEVAWLVIRCLGTLGQFDSMVAMLTSDDKDRKQFWMDCADQLQEAVNRGPETAAAVRKLFEKDFGAAAPESVSHALGLHREATPRRPSQTADRPPRPQSPGVPGAEFLGLAARDRRLEAHLRPRPAAGDEAHRRGQRLAETAGIGRVLHARGVADGIARRTRTQAPTGGEEPPP